MKKLLTERKEYCTLDKEIDAAYDALDSVDVFQQPPKLVSDLQFDGVLVQFANQTRNLKIYLQMMNWTTWKEKCP